MKTRFGLGFVSSLAVICCLLVASLGFAQDDEPPPSSEQLQPMTQIPGNPGDLAIVALPFAFDYDPEEPAHLNSSDFEFNDGYYYSAKVFELWFSAEATIGEANGILASLNAEILASMPGRPDHPELGELLLMVRTTTTSFNELKALAEALEQNPLVKTADPLIIGVTLNPHFTAPFLKQKWCSVNRA
jgi:hypothetical protein